MSLKSIRILVRDRLGSPALVVAAAATLLCFVGVIVAASVDACAERTTGYAKGQATRLALAVPIVLGTFLLRPRRVKANAYVFYGVGIALLYAVLELGTIVNGARRWLAFGSTLRFQPSDVAKLAVCLALARFCAVRPRVRSLPGVLGAFALAAIPAALIVREPDLGTALNLFPIALAVLFVAGARRSHLALAAGALVLVALIGLAAYGLHGYQVDRIETWWRQNELTAAEKQAQGFHLYRSKTAIGSGGLLGYGWGEGPQNVHDLLPERHTDFAFAVIAEEWGLFGASIVLLLELAIPFGLLALAARVREPFARLSIVAIATQVGAQALVNMGVATGVFPTTGIALPLVSFGGSSAMVTLAGLALALHLAARAEPELAAESFEPEEEATLLDRPRRR